MRFHLVDKVTEICYDKYIVGVKCITLADDVFNEHFPGHPIFPGSLIMEGMAQLAGSFFEINMNEKQLPLKRSVLTIVNHLKFRKPAYPGDRLIYRADIKSFRIDEFGVAKVTATMDGELYAEGELLFTFFNIPCEKLEDSRRELYDICLRYAKVIEE
jgi:3-hydroxyacyl-[acyl-carrier-protein] dehydratase